MAGGLRELPSVHLAELPHMADYAIWVKRSAEDWDGSPGRSNPTEISDRSDCRSDMLQLFIITRRGARN